MADGLPRGRQRWDEVLEDPDGAPVRRKFQPSAKPNLAGCKASRGWEGEARAHTG